MFFPVAPILPSIKAKYGVLSSVLWINVAGVYVFASGGREARKWGGLYWGSQDSLEVGIVVMLKPWY